jgi:TRAP-type mannitol/chloroaromatic compound transport system permease large subunit
VNALLGLSRVIDAVSEPIGRFVYWLLLAAVLVSTVNAIVRKAFDVGSNAYLEAQWYLFATMFMLGAGYVLLHDQHVRIDVIATRLSEKVRAWIEVAGLVAVLIPLCLVIAWMSLPSVMLAFSTGEVSANPGGLIRWPLYALVPVGMCLLALQAFSELIQEVAFLTGRGEDPHAVHEPTAEEILLEALPMRLYGIMSNDTLLAIPFFTFMGLILERSRMAEDLLETIGQVFGPMRGGLAVAVVIVGAMLAATTGVVAASVIAMGLISLPIMLRYGYNRPLAAGVITASGTLAQIIPPSLVLIVIADQLGRSVGDMYRAAFIPAFGLVAVYAAAVMAVAVVRPKWVPALPLEARLFREASGSSGYASLSVLTGLSVLVGGAVYAYYPEILKALGSTSEYAPPTDARVVMALMVTIVFALVIAMVDRGLGLNRLSQLARRVTFVLIPPLLLVFLVLGTIFLGIATPTEGGAMGAAGALILAMLRKRLDFKLLKQALDASARLSIFVVFVLIGSTVFALTFQAINGPHWVEALFAALPGGQLGFLLFVSGLIFVLGFFLDFFEIAFILLPLLAPVAEKLGVDLIYFGVLIGLVLQTSFLTPPFGFALFYLRSVAPKDAYIDTVTKLKTAPLTTVDIYKGSLAFVVLQVMMVVAVLIEPQIIMAGLGEQKVLDVENVDMNITAPDEEEEDAVPMGGATPK